MSLEEEEPPEVPEAEVKPQQATTRSTSDTDGAAGTPVVVVKTKKKGKKSDGGTRSKRVVPIWYLFRFSKWPDILMIIIGTIMAIAAGCALPAHMLMFGDVIDLFISYDLSQDLINNFGVSLAGGNNDSLGTGGTSVIAGGNSSYFCDFLQDDSTSNILRFLRSDDRDGLLRGDVSYYSYYYVALATGMLIASFFSTLFWNLSAYRQTRKMRIAFFRSIMRQSIGWFDVNPSGELTTRLSDDIERIQAGIGDKAAIFIQYFTTFIAGFFIAFFRNWKLTLVVGTMLPVLSFLTGCIATIVAKFTVREQNAYASAGSVAEEVLSSIRTVLAFGGEENEIERYQSTLGRAKSEGFKKSIATSAVTGILIFVNFSTFALGFWYGAVLISNCELRAGQVVTVFFGVVIGSFSLGNALPELQTFATAMGSATGVFSVIDHESEIDVTQSTGNTIDSLEGIIELKDVIFKYPARPDVPVLNGLDLKIKCGQTVALVGASGCGKSTVIQLLQRFYNPIAGQITIDEKPIESLNLRWLRSNIGVVSQEPVLFDCSIAKNIEHGKVGATTEEIEAAARAANAHNFISELPDGYDTLVGEKGAQLSGGQKQRIAIARALVRDPKILLLDEATSALDTESEKIVQEALDKAREGRTTIIIAHRLSTIQQVDVIAGIEEGRVVEMGTHKELLEKKGLYYELVQAQTIDEEDEKSNTSLSGFRAALRRSTSRQSLKRQRSTHSTSSDDWKGPPPLERQTSNQSDVFTVISDHLSRISIEDIPVLAHPSPLPYKRNSKDTSEDKNNGSPSKKIMIVKPSKMTDKSVHFNVNEDEEQLQLKKDKKTLSSVNSKDTEKLDKVPLKELLKLNIPDWYLVIPGVIFSAIQGAMFPLISIIFSNILEIYSNPDRDELLRGASEYSTYFVALAVGAGIVQFFAIFTLSVAGERLTTRLRVKTFKAMLRQEVGWFDRRENATGSLTQRLATDASEVKGVTGIRFGILLQLIFGFITALIIAFTAAWLLAIVLFIAFPFLALVGSLQIRLAKGRSVRNKELLSEAGQTSTEAIDNVRTVVSLGAEDRFVEKYDKLLEEPFKANIRQVLIQAVIFGVAQGTIFYMYAAGFSLGVVLVVSDPSKPYHATYDELFRVFSAVVFTALTMGRASSFAPDAQKAQLSAARIFNLANREPEIDNYDTDGEKMATTTGHIEVKNVYFRYPARPNVPVLQGLSVSVEPGQTLALVGPSGCGKSTIVSLIERFYNPLGGSLLLEEQDIRDLNIRWLRNQIGIVSQEPVLFDKSIADNIRYGANFREVTDEEVIEAAKAANIHNFIQTLPQGYATNVGSKGTQLSGGQKQRIAIARALVRDPKILLLDEATSALDTESEKIVQEALDKAREGRTCIVIAHRLSTIYNSEKIAVIHNGQVIELGTHADLMEQQGAYYLLNTVQKKEEEEEEAVEL